MASRWTVASLIAAFIDLAIVYALLWIASMAFIASKILSFFKLELPCTCDRRRQCRGCIQQRVLVDYPVEKVADLRRRLPFGRGLCRCWVHGEFCDCFDGEVGGGNDGDDVRVSRVWGDGKLLEFGGKVGSCGSVESVDGGSGKLSLVGTHMGLIEGLDDKGKGVVSGERDQILSRSRRKRISSNSIGNKSAPLQLSWQGGDGDGDTGLILKSSFAPQVVSESGHHLLGYDNCLVEEVEPVQVENSIGDIDPSLSYKTDSGPESEPVDVIRHLKHALEEEQSSRVVLLLELEKERSASATAADEAMGMIFKLQEQKARLEMEARQYQRMVEEKSAYDEEELEILREIIIRREREKHFLEKQVNEYDLQVNKEDDTIQQLWADDLNDGTKLMGDNTLGSSSSSESMLKVVDRSTIMRITEKGTMQVLDDSKSLAMEHISDSVDIESMQNQNMEVRPEMLDHEDDCKVEEKGMVTLEVNQYPVQTQSSEYRKESGLLHKSLSDSIYGEESRTGKENFGDYLNSVHTSSGKDSNKQDSESYHFDTEATVLDVHVIDDRLNLSGKRNKSQFELPPLGASGLAYRCSVTNGIKEDMEQEISRTNTDATRYKQPIDDSVRHASRLHLRRSSMPEIEIERSRLENEVEVLRKRLVVVQQGKEKLKLSVEQMEKDKCHLHLLEDIASQLQELGKAIGNGKVSDHSLSPSSSVVNLKKRRCRSVSEGLNKNT